MQFFVDRDCFYSRKEICCEVGCRGIKGHCRSDSSKMSGDRFLVIGYWNSHDRDTCPEEFPGCCTGRSYGEIWLPFEKGQCHFNFEASNPERLKQLFAIYEAEAADLIEKQLPAPALDFVLKCSHTFNLLDARGAISVTERAAYIGRIRNLSRLVAQAYYDSRERLGFPMCGTAAAAVKTTEAA